MGWTRPLQRASYRGIRFDVLEVTDSFERTLAEHTYPFINGADIEDMGLAPRRVQLQAVFFGDFYHIALQKFLKVLQAQGAGVLVHPVFGRIPDMICQSASLKHEGEFVNYVALDLTFIETTEAKPIFVFEHSLLSQIDRLFNQIDDYLDQAFGLFHLLIKGLTLVKQKSRLIGVWYALLGLYREMTALFALDARYTHTSVPSSVLHSNLSSQSEALPLSVATEHFSQQTGDAMRVIAQVLENQLSRPVSLSALTVRAYFDEVLRTLAQIKQLPKDLSEGKRQYVRQAAVKTLAESVDKRHIKELDVMLRLLCTASLTKLGVGLIEDKVDGMTPAEIEYIAKHIRLSMAESIDMMRALQQIEMTGSQTQANTGVYTQYHQVMEQLRRLAHGVSQLAINAINRKPPLVLKTCPINGTLHQVAHAFYGDYRRAAELLRLNPQVREPNFMRQGELLNAYSE